MTAGVKAKTGRRAGTPRPTPESGRGRVAGLLESDLMLERQDTLHRDCVLTDYDPRCNPAGHLHNATLLRYLLRQENLLADVWPMIERVWDYLGHDQTVWGAKWSKAGFHSFELYFYNPAQL